MHTERLRQQVIDDMDRLGDLIVRVKVETPQKELAKIVGVSHDTIILAVKNA